MQAGRQVALLFGSRQAGDGSDPTAVLGLSTLSRHPDVPPGVRGAALCGWAQDLQCHHRHHSRRASAQRVRPQTPL